MVPAIRTATQAIGSTTPSPTACDWRESRPATLRGALLDHANRLSQTFAALVEAFERVRSKGPIRIEHVTVEKGANAVIGNVGD